MGRVGFLSRFMLILMAALLAMIAVTFGVDRLAHRSMRVGAAIPYPRIVHAAGLIDLVRSAGTVRQQTILRGARDILLRISIVTAAPAPAPGDIPAPRIAERLQSMLVTPVEGLRAYTDDVMARPRDRPDIEGTLTKAIAPLDDGRYLVIHWVDPPQMKQLTLLGLSPSVWTGVLGFGVALLALVAAAREGRPLRHLTEAVSRFDGTRPAAPCEDDGAPDIRRLAQAVHGMQERVAGLLAERSFLIGAISHDLRTYLTRLRLRTEGVADPAWRERMVDDLDAMTRLIQTSLAFARGTTSSQNRIPIDLSDLVATEVEEHAALGLAPTLSATYAADATVVGDPLALRRVVCNILDNALKFARSAVTVRVERTASHERIVIEDDGPGIPEAECKSVFDPFYRVEQSRSRATGGTGLGLAIANQIVEAHGGSIEAAAASTGGASFTIELPRSTRRVSQATAPGQRPSLRL